MNQSKYKKAVSPEKMTGDNSIYQYNYLIIIYKLPIHVLNII